MKTLVLLSLMLCLALPALAQTNDNLGRPIAKAGVLGAAAEPRSVHMFDLEIVLGGEGANDASSASEAVVAGVNLFWYATENFKPGVAMTWDAVDRSKVELYIPADFLLFYTPERRVIFHAIFDVLPHFTAQMDIREGRENAWTWMPNVTGAIEYPMDSYAIKAEMGLGKVLTQEGVDISGDSGLLFSAGVAWVFRLGR